VTERDGAHLQVASEGTRYRHDENEIGEVSQIKFFAVNLAAGSQLDKSGRMPRHPIYAHEAVPSGAQGLVCVVVTVDQLACRASDSEARRIPDSPTVWCDDSRVGI
jgi:hypothetical protein